MRTRSQKILWPSVAVGALLVVCAAPASAGEGFFELYGGVNFIGGDVDLRCNGSVIVCTPEGASGDLSYKPGFDDDTPTFGLAGGRRVSDKLALLASLSWVDGDDTLGEPVKGSNLELNFFFIDLSARYFPKSEGFFVLGGIGLADIRAKAEIAGPDPTRDAQKFTLHGGLGGEWGQRKYFLAQAKVRYIDSTVYDDLDVEVIVGIGFRSGG